MYNFMRKLRKHQKGFTLIELLVVVAILGVLAAVIV
ncbi:type IV pilin protein, partial [Dehalococcoides sp. HCBD]